ncbi:uncharacterized protein LODBEIA_P35950 [Lodderomyces beijingensis]|uniref:Major facilitator superfamily (MFS) profile domain-containing protein n=1 Tax=Lodderomyces beijingensis TaxID=1775926 RepID=A0ABP0ZMI3_9ASCO
MVKARSTQFDIEKPVHSRDEAKSNLSDSSHSPELTPEHQQYLISRHGTVKLDPIPSQDPNDPLNWPQWQKNYEILNITFSTFSSTFMASGMNSAFEPLAKQYNSTLTDASYFTSVQIAIFGIFPFLWVPLMNTWGRKPFLVMGALGCCACNIGGGFAKTYGQQMATRALSAFFIATATSAGSSVVGDLAFAHERGRKNGWWSVGFVAGTPMGSFITGFIQYHAGTKWIFFTYAIMNFCQCLGWVFSRETIYSRNSPDDVKFRMFRVSKARPFAWSIFVRPFHQALNGNILLAVLAASITFCYANIVLSVEMPQVMIPLFHLNPQQMSLQYISMIIGSAIGEILAGPLSDWWMAQSVKRRLGHRVVVDRLWVSYNGYILVIVGLIVWGVCLAQATPGHWTIKPLVGIAIAATGNNIVATVVTTFAIDCNPRQAGDVGIFLNFWRSLYGFIGPFYFPKMFENLGIGGSAGLMCGLVVLFAWAPTCIAHGLGIYREKRQVM